MTYSLINVSKTNKDGTINGGWIQDHIGDIKSASDAANRTEEANSNKILVAVVAGVGFCTPCQQFSNLERLA